MELELLVYLCHDMSGEVVFVTVERDLKDGRQFEEADELDCILLAQAILFCCRAFGLLFALGLASLLVCSGFVVYCTAFGLHLVVLPCRLSVLLML